MFLSVNFGQSWTSKSAPTSGALDWPSSLFVDPEQPNRLYAAASNGRLFVSGDSASTWVLSQQSVLGPSKGLALLPRACSGGGLFGISSADGVARSLDFASGWQSTQFGFVSVVATGPGCAVYAARNLRSGAFVAKLAPGGTEVLWSTFLGAGSESADAMAVDPNGNVYVAGETRSKEFPATSPRIGPEGGYWDLFVTKYDPSGYIVYSVVLAGGSWPEVAGLAADWQGDAYVVGATPSQAFPTGRVGYVVKLTPHGGLVYSSNVGSHGELPTSVAVDRMGQAFVAGIWASDGLHVTPDALQTARGPGFLLRLDPTGSTITYASYIGGTDGDRVYDGAFALVTDPDGNVYVAGSTAASDFPLTPGAYFSGLRSRSCNEAQFHYNFLNSHQGDLFVLKLRAADLQLVYAALLGGECRAQPTALRVDSRGEVALSVNAGLGFPLRSPLAGAPTLNREYYLYYPNQVAVSSSIAVLSATGSSLIWSSYLDSSVPAVAFAPDGSLYAAVVSGALDGKIGHGSVWRLPVQMAQDVSIDSVANAFSGFSDSIAPGSLIALTGTNLSSDVIDLGLNSPQDLPTELGGVRVYFDGVPAHILQIAPRRVICVAPLGIQDGAVLQLISAAGMSNPVIMPVNQTAPGLLTRSFPEVAPFGRDANGVVRNEDGALNDADHPAARGSTVTLYATGLGLTTGSGDPGSIATTDEITPAAPFYAWWCYASTSPPASAATMPGFVSSILQVKAPVPAIGLNDGTVQRLTVALESFVRVDAHMNSIGLPSPADQVVVYVK